MAEDKDPRPGVNPAEEFERQRKRKVFLLAVVLSILCALFIWRMFSLPEPRTEGKNGINATVPDGRVQHTEGDKRKAAEQVRTQEQQDRRMGTLGDNSFSLLDEGLKTAEQASDTHDPVTRAEQANSALHAQVHSFYTTPARNPELEVLKEQVQELEEQLEAERRQPDALQLAEEQYKLAQKYLGTGQQADAQTGEGMRKSRTSAMRPLDDGDLEATTLNPQADFGVERNLGFLTAAGRRAAQKTTGVHACVACTQVIRNQGTVSLRLLEAVRIDGVTIPRNTTIYGTATISGMRLQVVVTSLEFAGRIFTVEALAYDLDGQPGLNVPDSRERTALKEALASVGQTAGMSVNVTHNAGQQLLGEVARGGLQASTRYISEKLREVKVTLKANHRLLLISKEQ